MMKIESGCVSIFLNRNCPRKCPYCNVVDRKKEFKRLSTDQWKKVFRILEKRGVDFFLILGTEPLMMESNLVDIVKFWKENNYEYGFYTTSPGFYFNKWADKLVDSGLQNWSSGIDFIPQVYLQQKNKLSEECVKLVNQEWLGLIKKAADGLYGMEYMHKKKITEQHVLITISRMNIEFVPEMIKWLVDRFGSTLRVALNYVEYSNEKDMDFATPKEFCKDYLLFEKDKHIWKQFINKMKSFPNKYVIRVQIPFDYLYNWSWIVNLDRHGNKKYCALSIECDGSIRKCGYKKGTNLTKYNILECDNDNLFNRVYDEWQKEVNDCKGCYWVFPYMLEVVGKDVVNYQSNYWKKRKNKFDNLDVKK